MKLLPALLVLMIVVPNLLGGEEEAAPSQVLIEAKVVRGLLYKSATISGSDLPRVIEDLRKAAEDAVACAPSVVCEDGHLATVTVESEPVFTGLAGKEKIAVGTRLDFRPAISADGRSVAIELEARITRPDGGSGFVQLRRGAKLTLTPGVTSIVRLGSLPRSKPLAAEEDVPLSLLLTVHPVK